MVKKCEFWLAESAENPACAWCEKFFINLDKKGKFCARCGREPAFRAMLGRQAAVRFGGDCEGDKTYCEVFATVTDAQQCERCKSDPEFRAFLYGQATARSAGRGKAKMTKCSHRGKVIRMERRVCCGGQEKEVGIFECSVNGEASEAACVICERRTDD